MRGNELLDKMELADPAYVEAADRKPLRKRHSWIAWAAGFIIGVLPMFGYLKALPFNPVISFFVGAGLYAICMKAGLKTKLVK